MEACPEATGACLENMKAEIDADQEEMKVRQQVMETHLEEWGVSR
jgi:hypothetical protein